MIYLKSTTTSSGRGSNDKLTLKENAFIFLLSALPMAIAIILHYFDINLIF